MIFLIQLGKPVKSIEVPDVDATAVANVLTELVAVAASKVSVFVPATAGAASVTAPDVSPDMTSELIYFLYKITQRLPLGIVTAVDVVIAVLETVCETETV